MTRITELWKELLGLIGDDPQRIGLKDTPERITKMYAELFQGYDPKLKPKITVFPNGSDGMRYNQLIIDEGTFSSFCEHHCLPFTGRYWFAYIPHPKGNILGLSKVAHAVRYYSAKVQVQERLVKEIIDALWDALVKEDANPKGMALVLRGKHMCKSLRGVRQDGDMTTIELRGMLREDSRTRNEFLNFVNGGAWTK